MNKIEFLIDRQRFDVLYKAMRSFIEKRAARLVDYPTSEAATAARGTVMGFGMILDGDFSGIDDEFFPRDDLENWRRLGYPGIDHEYLDNVEL